MNFLEGEESEESAGRLVPEVEEPDLTYALAAARRDLAAFSSEIAVFIAGKSEDAISATL